MTKIERCRSTQKWNILSPSTSKFPIPPILGVTYTSKDLISWDSRVFKNFLWTLNPSCGYSEHSSDSYLSNAPTLVSVQRLETSLRAKKI